MKKFAVWGNYSDEAFLWIPTNEAKDCGTAGMLQER